MNAVEMPKDVSKGRGNALKISEITCTLDRHGSLMISGSLLFEMGLGPGDSVRVAYLSTDGIENSYQEFLLSPDPLEQVEEARRIAVPTELLAQANIPPDADIQVVCIDGAIVLSQDPILQAKDLQKVLSGLEIAGEFLEELSADPEPALEALWQLFDSKREGSISI